MIDPNIKVMISALRKGKSEKDALRAYCWAKLALPVLRRAHSRSSPETWPIAYPDEAMARAMDAFADGADDTTIAAEFIAGLEVDARRDIFWRTMSKDEYPTASDLIRGMDTEEKLKAAEFVGMRTILRSYKTRRPHPVDWL